MEYTHTFKDTNNPEDGKARQFVITPFFCYEIVPQKNGTINIYKSEKYKCDTFPSEVEYGNGSQAGFINF